MVQTIAETRNAVIHRMPVDVQSRLQSDVLRDFRYLGRFGDRRYETVVAGEADGRRTGLVRIEKIGAKWSSSVNNENSTFLATRLTLNE